MAPEEIVTLLSRRLPDPAEVIFALTMQDLLSAIANQLGETALLLTPVDMFMARDEVRAVLSHYLDEREMLACGLAAWNISKSL